MGNFTTGVAFWQPTIRQSTRGSWSGSLCSFARAFRHSIRPGYCEPGHHFTGTLAAASDSCILCVEKHVGRAIVLWEELLSATGSGTKEGEASVNVYRNHIKIIGHLGNAYDESADFVELHEMLKEAERNYRYEGIVPNWEVILKDMERVKSQQINKNLKIIK